MNSEIREFRDGIFALRTRRFGTVAELMIEALYNFTKSTMNFRGCILMSYSESI